MGRKCLVVAHNKQNYRLYCQDLKKIIFKAKRSAPLVPAFEKIETSFETE